MWRRPDLRPSTAIGVLMAAGLVVLILLGAAVLAQLLWALLALGVFAYLSRREG